MPTKNQTNQTEPTKTVKTAKTVKTVKTAKTAKTAKNDLVKLEPVHEEVQYTDKVVETTESVQSESVQSEDKKDKKSVRKAGRTLLVKSSSGSTIDGTVFDSFEGLTNKAETKSTNSFFLTFDNISNAVKAFRKLRTESSTYRVKFSYYRIFFTINGLTDSSDYNQVKKELKEYVDNQTKSSVLYCKLYRKDNKFLGCGDLTIDTLTGMNTLLSKDGNNKEYSFGTFKGIFYRFNGKKDKSTEQTTEVTN